MNDTAVEEAYAAMNEWFTSKGGRLDGVRLATIPGKPGDGRGLIATEDSPSGTRAIRVPASLTLSSVSSRNLRFKQETVGEQLRSLWVENQERALAVLLLHEWLKEHAGEGSAWGPYLRTLGLPAMGKSALRAVAGTYAAELWAERAADAVDTVSALSSTLCVRAAPLCQKEPGKAASGFHTRDDVRWALGVVRSRAVWVSRRTTGSTFLALVPFLDLVPHHPRAGGRPRSSWIPPWGFISAATRASGMRFRCFAATRRTPTRSCGGIRCPPGRTRPTPFGSNYPARR